jgi:hypothetical protein
MTCQSQVIQMRWAVHVVDHAENTPETPKPAMTVAMIFGHRIACGFIGLIRSQFGRQAARWGTCPRMLAFEKSGSKQNGLCEVVVDGRLERRGSSSAQHGGISALCGTALLGATVSRQRAIAARGPGGTLEISPPEAGFSHRDHHPKTTPPRRGGGSLQDTRVPSPLPGRVPFTRTIRWLGTTG